MKLVITNQISCLILGGVYESSALRYQTSNINNGPIEVNTVHDRAQAACTIFRSPLHSGRPLAIVAGSFRGNGGNTAEIWDYTMEGRKWELSTLFSVKYFFSFFPVFSTVLN